VVVNKWDTVTKDSATITEYEKDFRSQLRPVSWAPYVFITATSGQRVNKVVSTVLAVGEQYKRRIKTGLLNIVIQVKLCAAAMPLCCAVCSGKCRTPS
jgi:GTP-binding protein